MLTPALFIAADLAVDYLKFALLASLEPYHVESLKGWFRMKITMALARFPYGRKVG